MTTVAYYRDVLYTDSRHVFLSESLFACIVEDKAGKAVILDKNGQVFGYLAGSPDSPCESICKDVLESLFHTEYLKVLQARLAVGTTSLEPGDPKGFILVLKDEILTIRYSVVKNGANDVEVKSATDMDWPCAIGSGKWLAIGYLAGGSDPKNLMRYVSQVDSMSSPHTYAYHRKHLKEIKRLHTDWKVNMKESLK